MSVDADQQFDVAIIGGGIHGAGVAQAAAAAGYKTLVIEQRDWAAGTSSRSSKLLHGGLRYLETAQFSLVYQSLQERNRLLSLAPDIAHPLRFHIPVYRNTRRRPWQLFIGLSLYALLSGMGRLSRFSSNSPPPEKLKTAGLQKVFSYWDGQTDDQRLTRAVIRSAQALGVTTLCPASLKAAQQIETGYQLQIDTSGTPQTLHTRYIVNCAGPWVNQVLATVTPTPQVKRCDLVKGSHLIVQERLSDDAFYLESPSDGRAIFLLPWGEHSLLGTTEQAFSGDPQQVAVSAEERDYLLAAAKAYFPEQTFTVIEEFAGLRVLPTGDSAAFSRPRECVLHRDPAHPGLLSLYGGKLTTYRHTAEQVVEQIQQQLGKRPAIADTRKLPLSL